MIPTSNISAGPLPDAVGRRFRYAASQARLNGRVVRRPIYRLQELSAADLLRDYRVPAAELGLTGSIRLFRVLTIRGRAETPVLELGATVLADPVGRLIAMWDGQFYELQRVR